MINGLFITGLFLISIGLIFAVIYKYILHNIGLTVINILILNSAVVIISYIFWINNQYGRIIIGELILGSCSATIIAFFFCLLILKFVKLGLKDIALISIVFTLLVILSGAVYFQIVSKDAKKYIELKELKKPGLGIVVDYAFINKNEREQINTMFSSYILDKYFNWSNINPKQHFESHEIFGIEKRKDLMFIYGYVDMQSYYTDDRNNNNGCGGRNPIVLIAKRQNNAYAIIDYIEPNNGTEYTSSISVMFPRKYFFRAITPTENQVSSILEQRDKYLKSIGR